MEEPTRAFNPPGRGIETTQLQDSISTAALTVKVNPSGFRLDVVIGQGGMGVVWRARDLLLDRDVAVKLLQDHYEAESSTAERFLDEARITSQLQHPGIPAIYQVGTLPNRRPFLAMKLIKGRTLEDMIRDREGLNVSSIFEGICQAVGYAHAHGIIHRDLKPTNIMVGAFGEVQVMDWGLAKLIASPERERPDDSAAGTVIRTQRDTDGSATQAGSVLGTLSYMAPEQALGDTAQIGERSDVFGLGAILCAMLTGSPPYAGATVETVRINAVRGNLDDALAKLAACGGEPELVALCKQCLSFKPEERPPNGGALAAQVATLRGEAEERAKQVELDLARAEVEAAAREKRRRGMMIASVAALVGLLAAITGTTIGLLRARAAQATEALALQAERERAEGERLARDDAERQRKQAEKRLANVEKSNEILASIFENLDPNEIARNERPLQAILVEKLDKAVALLDAEAIGDDLMVATMQRKLGSSLLGLGAAQKAIPLFERCRATLSRKLGPEHPDTLTSMNNLAAAYHQAGKFELALPLYVDTIKLRKAVQGPDHRDTLKCMQGLAGTYVAAGKYDLAVTLYEEALALQTAKLGPDDPDTHQGVECLAFGYWSAGKVDQALPLFEATHNRKKTELGFDHPSTLNVLSNIATCYQLTGKPEQAQPITVEVLRIRRAKLGPDHPDTLMSLGTVAYGYWAMGRHDLALPLSEETYRRRKAALGPDHPHTLMSMHNLATGYASAGKHELAIPLHEETLKLRRVKLGPDHLDTVLSLQLLADAYTATARHDRAMPLLEEAVALQTASLGPDHTETLISTYFLAKGCQTLGKRDRALALFEAASRGSEKLKFQNEYASAIVTATYDLYEAAGDDRSAEVWRRKWLPVVKAKAGAESAAYASELAGLAYNLLSQSKWADAEPICRDCLALREQLAPDSWLTFNTASMLGESLAGQKKFTEAEPLLIDGYENMIGPAASLPPGSNRPREAVQRLIDFYIATNQPAKVKQWQAKLPTEFAPLPRKIARGFH